MAAPLVLFGAAEGLRIFRSRRARGQRELAAYLRANPDLIQKWLGLSDGKRVSEGWYMLPPDASFDGQHWVVGYYPVGKYFVSLDAADACAHYVKQEIEGWRAHLANM